MKKYVFWDSLILIISKEDWAFLCDYRFFTDKPQYEDVLTEFVTGTGITPNKKELWAKSSEKFAEYIMDLKEIMNLDINEMARNTLTNKEKYK